MSAWGGKNDGPWGKPPSGGGGGRSSGSGGGKRPPDLDELIRSAQERLRRMWAGGDDPRKGLAFFAAAALVLWLASGIYFVKADEQGVVLRFGLYHRVAPPGLNYHLPYPFETVMTPKVTVINKVEVGFRAAGGRGRYGESQAEESLMLTGDENIIDINFEVQWRIADAPDFLFNVRDPEDTVKAVAESAMREVVGKTQIATILAEGKLLVEQSTKKLIQDTLNSYKTGVEVVSVNLLKADPPAQVIDAFRDVQTARADLETARNQAEAYRNDILPRARGLAEQMVQESEAYKQEVVARATGEASRFASIYAEYKEARDATKRRMYLETMEEILQGMTKVIVEGKSGVVPYLPLPEIKARAEEKPAADTKQGGQP